MNNISNLKNFSGQTIALEDLCISITDCPHSTPKWTDKGKIVIRNFNIKNGELDLQDPSFTDNESFNDRIKRAKPEPGDIILTREAPMGEVALIPEGVECCLGQRMVLLKVDQNKISSEYLLFALQSEFLQKQIKKSDKTGSIVSNLCLPDLKNLRIPIFPDMNRRGEILGLISEKIRLNNKMGKEIENFIRKIYDFWFIQFDFPDANGNPYKSSGGEMVYSPKLKQNIPKGWEVNLLSEWIRLDKTGDWGKEVPEGNYSLKVDCIRGADINGLNGLVRVEAPTRFILEKNTHKLLEPFDCVIEISGGSPIQSTGRLSCITKEMMERFENPLICSNFCKAISLKNINLVYNFTYFWNKLYENKVFFSWEGKTSGIKNLLFDSFVNKNYICTPPNDLAEQFFKIIYSLSNKKQVLLKANKSLEETRSWLLPLVMNGQVSIRDAEEHLVKTIE